MEECKEMSKLEELTQRFLEKKHVLVDTYRKGAYCYDGRCYNQTTPDQFRKIISDYITEYEEDVEWGLKLIDDIYKSVMILGTQDIEMNSSQRYINLQNGIYDSKRDILLKHSYKFFSTDYLRFDYDANATAPTMEKFLSDVSCGDARMIFDLKVLLGVALFGKGHSLLQKAAVFRGDGSNGKSTYVSILEKLIPSQFVTHFPISTLNSARSFDKIGLQFSRVNIVHEMPREVNLNELISKDVKAIITGDPIAAEHKFGEQVSFICKSLLIFLGNTDLEFDEVPQEAVLRRLIIYNFNAEFKKDTVDKEMFSKLEAELPGIFIMAKNALAEFEKNGCELKMQNASDEELRNMIIKKFPIESFVEQAFIADGISKTRNDKIYIAFREWMQKLGMDDPVEVYGSGVKERLSHAISRQYPASKSVKCFSGGKRGKEGIRLKPEYEPRIT